MLAAAGRDDDSWARYLDAVHVYWQEFSAMTGSRVKTVELLTPGQSDPFAATRPKLDQVPGFRYQPAPQPLLRVLPKLAGILVWGTIALITTMRRFAGVDPR